MRTLQVKRWRKRDGKLTWQPPMPYNLGMAKPNYPMPAIIKPVHPVELYLLDVLLPKLN